MSSDRDPGVGDLDGHVAVLHALGLTEPRLLSWRDNRCVFRAEKGATSLAVKFFRGDPTPLPYPVAVHQHVLPRVSPGRRLVTPRVLDLGHAPGVGHFVLLSWLEGRDFHDRWHARRPSVAGGVALDGSSIEVMLDLIDDLRELPTTELLAVGLEAWSSDRTRRLVARSLRQLQEMRAVTERQVELARESLRHLHETSLGKLVVSNQDFRHANLIEVCPERTALVDWDGARCTDHEVEHCIAYPWLFMWANPEWQRRWLRDGAKRFDLTPPRLQATLIERSLVQAYTERNNPRMLAIHLQHLELALDPAYLPSG